MKQITSSPWGRPDSVREIAPGIIEVSCPGHGGTLVTPEQLALMPEAFRLDAGPEGAWYEEDCEACLVILAFPDAYPPSATWHAMNFIRADNMFPKAKAFVESDAGADLRQRHKRFAEEHADLYSPGCMSTEGNGWRVCFSRISDGRQAVAVNLTDDEAFAPAPVDLSRFGDRVTYASA